MQFCVAFWLAVGRHFVCVWLTLGSVLRYTKRHAVAVLEGTFPHFPLRLMHLYMVNIRPGYTEGAGEDPAWPL